MEDYDTIGGILRIKRNQFSFLMIVFIANFAILAFTLAVWSLFKQ
jgi:hypothetical protein